MIHRERLIIRVEHKCFGIKSILFLSLLLLVQSLSGTSTSPFAKCVLSHERKQKFRETTESLALLMNVQLISIGYDMTDPPVSY